LGILFLFIFAFSKKRLEADARVVSAVMLTAGCLLVSLATVGRLWCAQYIAGRKNASLIVEGPYSVTRNPLYFFSFLGGTGVGLCTESITLATVIVLLFTAIYPVTIQNEERKLSAIFGASYEDYVSKVPRFFPKWSLFREPAEYSVNTRVFRREIIDAMYFVWVVGVFEFIEALIEVGFIGTFITIY
jgi:protein-S-isoprenylcysteine O-methyltransferase Ste14